MKKEKRGLDLVIGVAVSAACLAAGLLICGVAGMPFPKGNNDQAYIRDIVPRVVASFACILFMRVAYRDVALGFRKKGFAYGLKISFLMYLYIAENFMEGASVNAAVDLEGVSPHTYLLCFLSTMAVGFFEEVLLRGTVLNVMRKHFSGLRHGLYAAVFGSSFLFGIAHMLNYINGHAYLRPTIAQVFYATFIGVFMAAVYVKSGNLWVVILLHGLFDFAAEFWELVTPTYSFDKQDMSWAGVGYLIELYLPIVLAGIFLVWRKEREEAERR